MKKTKDKELNEDEKVSEESKKPDEESKKKEINIEQISPLVENTIDFDEISDFDLSKIILRATNQEARINLEETLSEESENEKQERNELYSSRTESYSNTENAYTQNNETNNVYAGDTSGYTPSNRDRYTLGERPELTKQEVDFYEEKQRQIGDITDNQNKPRNLESKFVKMSKEKKNPFMQRS